MGSRRDIWEWGFPYSHPQVRYRVHLGAGSLCPPGMGDLCGAVPLTTFAPRRDVTPSSVSPNKRICPPAFRDTLSGGCDPLRDVSPS